MQQQPNMTIAFLQELLQRLFTKSPLFFRIWQWISGLTAIVTGLPATLAWFGITLPPSMLMLQNKAVTYAALGALLMSKLTTQSKAAGVLPGGDLVKKTDTAALPFTAANEQKKAESNPNIPQL